jgi:hypothetical protein
MPRGRGRGDRQNGLEAAQYHIALKQVEGDRAGCPGQGSQTIIVPADAVDAFGKAFQMLKGRSCDVERLVGLGGRRSCWPSAR